MVEAVIKRVKARFGFKSQTELANAMGLSTGDFSNRKKRGTLLPPIIDWLLKQNVSIDLILKGDETETGPGILKDRFSLFLDYYLKRWEGEHDLAEKSGIPACRLRRIRNGEEVAGQGVVIKILDAMEISQDDTDAHGYATASEKIFIAEKQAQMENPRIGELLRMARYVLEADHPELSPALEQNIVAFHGAVLRDPPEKNQQPSVQEKQTAK